VLVRAEVPLRAARPPRPEYPPCEVRGYRGAVHADIETAANCPGKSGRRYLITVSGFLTGF